jgi:hypothetical protein
MWTPTVIEIKRLSPHRARTAASADAEVPGDDRSVGSLRAESRLAGQVATLAPA